MNDLVIRYSLPGMPLAILLYLWRAQASDTSKNVLLDAALFLAVAVAIGNIVQQTWMAIFELKWFGYNSNRRKVLVEFARIRESSKEPCDLYPEWESLLYSAKIPSDIRAKDRAMWGFFHANGANAFALLMGSVGAVWLGYQYDNAWACILGPMFLALALLLGFKALQTRSLIDTLEVHWLQEFGGSSCLPNKDGRTKHQESEYPQAGEG